MALSPVKRRAWIFARAERIHDRVNDDRESSIRDPRLGFRLRGNDVTCRQSKSPSPPKEADMPSFEHHGAHIYYEEFGRGFPILTFAPAGLQSTIAVWSQPSAPINPATEWAADYR